MLRAILFLFALGLPTSLIGLPATQATAVGAPGSQITEPQTIEGMVVSASAGQVSVRTADGKEQSFKPDAMTRITVHGKPGKLEELSAGLQIRVMVDKQGKVISISTIDDRK